MKIRYYNRVAWTAFLILTAVGGLIRHRLADIQKPDLSGKPKPVDAVPDVVSGRVALDVEQTLAALTAALEQSSYESQSQERIWACLRPLSPEHLEQLLTAAARQPSEVKADALVATLFGQLAALAPDRALAWAEKLPPQATDAALAGLLDFWAERDLPAARRWYEANVAGQPGDFPKVGETVAGWSRLPNVPQGAPLPFREILTAYQSARAARSPNEWLGEDAVQILDYFRRTRDWTSGLSASAGDAGLRRELHRIWSGDDPASWLEWMRLHPAEGVAEKGIASLGRFSRDTLFFQLLGSMLPQSRQSMPDRAVGPLLDQAVSVFLAEGYDFLGEAPSHSLLETPFMRGFGNWLECQPHQASSWLKRHQQEPWIDPLIATLVLTVVKEDPAAAFEWAARIRDETRRREIFTQAHAIWRDLDPTAADVWAGEHPAELAR